MSVRSVDFYTSNGCNKTPLNGKLHKNEKERLKVCLTFIKKYFLAFFITD